MTESRHIGNATLELTQGDITREAVDAIANAANEGLRGGGGVDGAIHRAGGPAIMAACRTIGGCPTGQAVVTTGGHLPAGHVIHTVGPIWHGGDRGEATRLASCYHNSLALAQERGFRSVAFPSISTGVYGYPVAKAAAVALGAVREFLEANGGIDLVRFVLFDNATYRAYADALAGLDA